MSEPVLTARARNLIEARDDAAKLIGSDNPFLKHLQREIDEAMHPETYNQAQQFRAGFRSSPPGPKEQRQPTGEKDNE